MELHEALRAIGAPAEFADAVAADEVAFEDAWQRCQRADHRIWLAACGGAPIEVVIETAALVVMSAAEELDADAVVRAAELAVAGALDELPRAVEHCEQLASGAVSGGYREAQHPALPHLARAGMLLANAAQGLAEGEARREAERLERAHRTAVLLGAGTSITLPAPDEPARLHPMLAAHDPAQGAFLFAVAACAEAIREVSAARLAGPAPSEELRARVERELDRRVAEALTE